MLKEETCFCEKMWENRLDRKLHCKTWQNLFTQIKETKLIQLQWKILHNIYPTNILLHKIGIKQSERCDFCEETDVVEHTFFRCERVQPFWKIVSQLIEVKLKKKIMLNETSIILGIEQDNHDLTFEEQKQVNIFLILAKFSIIKSRSTKSNINIIFERELQLRNIDI